MKENSSKNSKKFNKWKNRINSISLKNYIPTHNKERILFINIAYSKPNQILMIKLQFYKVYYRNYNHLSYQGFNSFNNQSKFKQILNNK